MLSSVVGCYVGTYGKDIRAVAAAVTAFNVAAEIASDNCNGPGTFKPALLDSLYALNESELDAHARCEEA